MTARTDAGAREVRGWGADTTGTCDACGAPDVPIAITSVDGRAAVRWLCRPCAAPPEVPRGR